MAAITNATAVSRGIRKSQMNDDLKELTAWLSKDKRLAEMTISFQGKNLKEHFPTLSREERADAVRIARALLSRWTDEDDNPGSSLDGRNVFPPSGQAIAADTPEEVPQAKVPPPERPRRQAVNEHQPQPEERSPRQKSPDTSAHPRDEFPGLEPDQIPGRHAAASPFGRGRKWALLFTGAVVIILAATIIAQNFLPTQPTNIDITGLFETQRNAEPRSEANQSTAAEVEPSRAAPPEQTVQPEPAVPAPSRAAPPEQTVQPEPAVAETTSDADSQQVREAQAHLSRLGYNPGPIDGIMGPKTRTAIEAFQRDHGLPVDGKVTQILLDSLTSSPP
jgi:hypothetical protein